MHLIDIFSKSSFYIWTFFCTTGLLGPWFFRTWPFEQRTKGARESKYNRKSSRNRTYSVGMGLILGHSLITWNATLNAKILRPIIQFFCFGVPNPNSYSRLAFFDGILHNESYFQILKKKWYSSKVLPKALIGLGILDHHCWWCGLN